ncbi:hypothetical protein [Streptodolium elevatio]|uniref:PBP domain-containing protein n=1 Tax=Streptodolium elevatio TaxID=3157996 RepID=A0ABV3DTM5_9ACTN
MFLSRPWHAPGLLAALPAFVLGALSGVAYLAGPASAAESGGLEVTLSQSTDLVNQRVKVAWSGFMPNEYALGIYQCRGTVPKGSDCDGVSDVEVKPETGQKGIVVGHRANYGVTGTSGEGWIQVLPKSDRPYLGCDADTPCIIAVVMRPKIGATVADFGPANVSVGSASANSPLSTEFDLAVEAGQAGWAPIRFAPEPENCADNGVALRLAGNSEHTTAGLSWQGGMCRAAAPMMTTVTAGTSPEGRDAFRAGNVDAAITSQPLGGPLDQRLGTAGDGIPGRKAGEVVYAPVTNGAIVLASNLESTDAEGRPVPLPPLNLTPRLVAKLLTDAYGVNVKYRTGSQPKKEVPGFPPTYEHYNSLFEDPEFTAINPGVPAPGSALHVITVRGANDDTIFELTRWLVSDRATREWLAGAVDENGIACPDVWRTGASDLPSGLITNRIEEYELRYRPISSYWTIVDNLVRSQGPEQYLNNGLPTSVPSDVPGKRAVIAVTSLEAAERMRLPVARLRNAAGRFVAPTAESIAAGVAAAKPGADGVTLTNDFAASDPKAYPLTTTDVVAFPTKELTKEKAASIDTYLAYASGPGQVPGLEPGRLPHGYAALNARQKQQIAAAREAVRKAAAAADSPSPTPSPTPPATGNTTGNGTGAPGGSGGDPVDGGPQDDGATTGGAAANGGTGGAGASPPPPGSPTPSASPRTGPAAATGDDGPKNLPAAIAERIKQALHGDPSAILFLVLTLLSLGAAVAAPVLLGIGWRRRTGSWPPPVAALTRIVRRRPTGAS